MARARTVATALLLAIAALVAVLPGRPASSEPSLGTPKVSSPATTRLTAYADDGVTEADEFAEPDLLCLPGDGTDDEDAGPLRSWRRVPCQTRPSSLALLTDGVTPYRGPPAA